MTVREWVGVIGLAVVVVPLVVGFVWMTFDVAGLWGGLAFWSLYAALCLTAWGVIGWSA